MKSPAIGIILGVVGSIGINVGMNMQSLGAISLPEGQQNRPWKSKMWLLGLFTFLACTVANFVAFMFAAASILVPLESIQLVSNVIFNRVVNKVEVPCRLAVGVLFAIVGTICVVGFGEKEATQLGINEVIECWTFWLWWLYCAFSFLSGILAMFWHAVNERRHAKGLQVWQFDNVQPILFSYSSAIMGAGQTIVHAKAASELLYDAAARPRVLPRPLEHWLFWIEVLLVAVFGIWWVVRQNQGLIHYDPLLVIPLMQAMYIVFGAISSGIFFREFWALHKGPLGAVGGWILFVGGIALVIIGLYFICPKDRLSPGKVIEVDARNASGLSLASTRDQGPLRRALSSNLDTSLLLAAATASGMGSLKESFQALPSVINRFSSENLETPIETLESGIGSSASEPADPKAEVGAVVGKCLVVWEEGEV